MGIFKRIKDWKHRNTGYKPIKPMVFEALEPRILLSGDSLLNIAAPEPLRDPLLDGMEQVVQYAELLETNEQVEEQISQELAPSNTPNTDVYQPVLTLFVDDDNTNDQSVDADLGINNIGFAHVNDEIALLSNYSDGDIESKFGTTEDDSPPIYVNDNDVSIKETTPIEIRGPPASETVNSEITASYLNYEESEVELSILNEYAAEVQPNGAVDLPGLYLVDPAVDYFDGQTVYFDFDGEENVTYNGPVTVEGIDVPAFVAPGDLAGQEQAIITEVLGSLEHLFAGSGIIFTTERPSSNQPYSTIYVDADASPGGNGSSWGTAYKYLQDALYKPATSGDEIWVAEGTYKPDEDEGGNVTPGDRTVTFRLINGVAIYGGFPSGGGWQDRDPVANETILSGDIGTPDVDTDNSYHVVIGSWTNAAAILDGFTITGGNANGLSNPSALFSWLLGGSQVSGERIDSGTTAGKDGIFSVPKDHDFTVVGEAPYKPGELIVRFAAKADGKLRSLIEKNQILSSPGGGNIKHNFKIVPGLSVVELPTGMTVEDALKTFNKTDEILYAEPNYKIYLASTTPNDTRFDDLWGMHNTGQTGGTVDADIDAPEAWDIAAGRSEIVVAVIDTGVDYTHPDLVANMWVNEAELNGIPGHDDDENGYVDDIYGWDFADDDDDPMDYYPHGTHCAGTVGAVGNNNEGVVGVCWDVKIMALKVFPNYGDEGFIAGAIEAIEYGVDSGAQVLSNSWGGGSYSQSLKDAIDAAGTAGMLFVAAAGNDGEDTDVHPQYPSSYDSESLISVMATDHDDNKAWYSNWGENSVDLAAPGGDTRTDETEGILSCVPEDGYAYMQGTSMATPHVSGACALLWSLNPALSHLEVKEIIMDSVDKVAALDGLCVTEGRLNLYKAVLETKCAGGGMYNRYGSPTVANCTFSGNESGFGGGMCNEWLSSPTITNCTFSGNSAGWGGGMFNDQSSATLTNCSFSGNTASGAGGGMYNYQSSPMLTNCTFSGNNIGGSGGGMYNGYSSPTINNCTFSGNSASYGGGMSNWLSSSPTLTNCTFSGNSANWYGGGMWNSDSSPTVTNCVLWGNTDSGPTDESAQIDGGTPVVTYSCVQGLETFAGAGNIDADPLFADADLRLSAGSPCINAGDNASLPADSADLDGDADTGEPIPFDLDGNPRIFNGIVDMGAYECQVLFVDMDATGANNGTSWADAYKYLQDALAVAQGGGQIWVAAGTYKPDQGGGNTTGDRTETFQLIDGVGIYGGFVGTETSLDERDWETNETILSGDIVMVDNTSDNGYHVVTGSGTDATAGLDGFTITGGNANGGGTDKFGGGMYNESGSPTVTNCTFSANSALYSGGGMLNYYLSNSTITNCMFSDNSAYRGGGMYNSRSSPTVTNCTFSGNSAGEDGGGMSNWGSSTNPALNNCTFSENSAAASGGGMYNYNNSPTLTNCTFSGNSAGYNSGGMYNVESNPTLTNCILWGNTAPTGPDIYNENSTPIVTYSDVQGGWSGTGNINADPLFADADLRLSADSPCIDAGDNTAVPSGVTTDLDGNPRFKDDPETPDTGNGTAPIVDMGAYEFPNTPTGSNVIVHLGPGIVAFAEVTAPGVTSLTTSSSGPEPPAGYMPGDPETYYDLSTTATYNGDIEVSIDYSGISYTNESSLRLMHYVDTDSDGTADAWVDATTSLDTGANIICGTVTSLSFFSVFEELENQPPAAAAGGPYSVDEGSSVILDGSGSTDPDQTTASLTYEWDFDNEGDYDDATGISPTFLAATLDGPTSVTVGLKVTDDYGEFDTATATIDVNNVAPAVGAGDDVTIDEGETVFFSGTASDVGDDTLTYLWDFGDGTGESGTLAPSHAYGDNGEYTVTLYVTDDDGATTSDTLTVTVNNVDPNVETIFLDVEITLRISGEKGNSVELMIEQEGDELRRLKLVRTTGAPNEGSVSVSIDLSKDYTATLYFESENKKGATPVWLIVDDHMVKITTFNAQKKKPDTWSQELEIDLDPVIFASGVDLNFRASANDAGSDDLTFTWDFGNGSDPIESIYFNDGTYPFSATDEQTYAYSSDESGTVTYTLTLTVEDDDGGSVVLKYDLVIHLDD